MRPRRPYNALATHRFEIPIAAPPELVFDLYTNLERIAEWTGGVTGVADVSGPMTSAGTTYTVHFGRMSSPTRVLEVRRPELFMTEFGNAVLRGVNRATFERDGVGTLMTQELRTRGLISAIAARIFATGSWKGSFRGELREFARIAERDALTDHLW